MDVSIINYTQDALTLLLFTKQTRLKMDAGLMDEIRAWPEERKAKELEYMLGTIESSWEFVDFTFSIELVSRAFTHQLVRTRDGSYAQQSQRTVDMTGFPYVTPETFDNNPERFETVYHEMMEKINAWYHSLIERGASPQDARAILPTNVATNIICKFNLATLSRMAEKRLCSRTQGEYQNVFRRMREEVLKIYPWCEPFIRVACAKRGVCQFPNYKECPIKPGIFNPDTGGVWPNADGSVNWDRVMCAGKYVQPLTKAEIQVRWEGMKFEAVPHAGGVK
jgi:flavin-dependent thymidylate synthase